MPGSGGNIQIGDESGANTNATSNDDLHITGKLETDGAAYFDSTVRITQAATVTGGITTGGAIASTGSALALNPASGYGLTSLVTKNASTGNEAAYDLSATINKATSGNYTGLKLNVTETSAPGTADKLLDLQIGGTSYLQVYNSADFANYGLLSIGTDDWDGSTAGYFSGSNNGTMIAINAASGYEGNLLDLQIGGTSKFLVDKDGNVTLGGTSGDTIADSDSDTKVQVEESADEDHIRFDTAGGERMVIDSSGNVGIGIAAPLYSLDVDEMGNSAGDLKIMPDIHGNVVLFGDTNVADEFTDGKRLRIYRKAAEGNTYLDFGISQFKTFLLNYVGGDMGFNCGTDDLRLQYAADGDVLLFNTAAEGDTQELIIGGWKTGDVEQQLEIGVGIDEADTASFDGVSNYCFDGNVGIGTTAPLCDLHIASDEVIYGCDISVDTVSSNAASDKSSLFLRRARGSLGSEALVQDEDIVGSVEFVAYDGDEYRYTSTIMAIVDGTAADNNIPTNMLFYTSSGPAQAEALRITSAGNVGIGTTGLGYFAGRTDIVGPSVIGAGFANATVNIFSDTAAAINVGGTLAFGGATGNAVDPYTFAGLKGAKESAAGDTKYSGYLAFYVNDDVGVTNEALRLIGSTGETNVLNNLKVDGYIGRGITPTAALHLYGASTAATSAIFNCTDASKFVYNTFTAGTNNTYFYNFGNTYTTANRYIQNSFLVDAAGAGGLSLAAYHADGVIRFYTNGVNERMRILANGNVGIGVADPAEELEVNGEVEAANLSMLDANTGGTDCLFVGKGIGASNTGNFNTFVGTNAGAANTSGINNTFFGYNAGAANTTASQNTYIGVQAGKVNVTGARNMFLGVNAGLDATDSDDCVFLGYKAGENTTGAGVDDDVFIGTNAGGTNTSGSQNVYIGKDAGFSNDTGNFNIAIGYQAGYAETGSYKLYIDSSNTTTPLIYGEFDNNIVAINGNVGIGTAVFDATAAGVLALGNATAPAAGTADQSYIYAKDVVASSEVHVMDEAGNETQISPHDPVTGEWIFYSRNVKTGKTVRVNMEKLVKAVERVTGEQFMVETYEESEI
ncbi:MAG: hypothetical protein ISS34_06305 [Candidatus Omnitrophica bacterium]|nr:hypothetical protein [Candidatus Omnitrophota bacterium]